uniref:Uncharacterized protein n=1 Tax=Arundo donax TaxID=35708 RepID=A0A0A9A228_ARUDO
MEASIKLSPNAEARNRSKIQRCREGDLGQNKVNASKNCSHQANGEKKREELQLRRVPESSRARPIQTQCNEPEKIDGKTEKD